MFDQHQEVANYLAVRNRNRAKQEAAGPLAELPPNAAQPQPRWLRPLALLRRIAAWRPVSRPRPRAGALRTEGR